MHIVQSLTIEPSDDIHNVAENDGPVEGSGLRRLTIYIHFCPLSLVDIKLVNVIETLLIGIDSSKNVYIASTDNSRMPIPRLRR